MGSPGCQNHGFNMIHIHGSEFSSVVLLPVYQSMLLPIKNTKDSSPLAELQHVYAINHVVRAC